MTDSVEKNLDKAVALIKDGRINEATALLKDCARRGAGPRVAEILGWAAQLARTSAGKRTHAGLSAALEKGDLADLEKESEALFAKDPAEAYRLLRDLWLAGAHGIAASAERSPWGCFFLSSQAWKEGRTLDALRLLSLGARRRAWMRYFAAELLLRRVDLYELAREQIELVVKDSSWLWEAKCLRAEILWAAGGAKPLAGLDKIEVPQNSLSAFLAWRGALELWTGEYPKALADLDAAAALNNPDAPCWRGGAKVMLGKLKEAVLDLTKLLDGDPDDHEARIWRGEAYRRLGLLDESLADLDAALARNDDALWALVNRALLHLERGDEDAARKDAARLAPPRFDGKRHVFDRPVPPAKPLKKLLEELLKNARGLRRSDPHLNYGWMRRAGAEIPAPPEPGARFCYWLRKTAPAMTADAHLVFGPETVTESAARAALQATLIAKAGGSSRKSRA